MAPGVLIFAFFTRPSRRKYLAWGAWRYVLAASQGPLRGPGGVPHFSTPPVPTIPATTHYLQDPPLRWGPPTPQVRSGPAGRQVGNATDFLHVETEKTQLDRNLK